MTNVGDTYNIPNADPWSRATEFDKEFIVPIFNSIVGNITKPVQVVDEAEADQLDSEGKVVRAGKVLKSHIEWIDGMDDDIAPIVNKKGGNFIYRELKLMFSRPAALGNLTSDELVNIAADNTDAIFINLIINDIEYGVDIDKLIMEMPPFLNTLHMYLTSIKDGGLLNFGVQTIGITSSSNANQKEENQGMYSAVKGNAVNQR